MVTVWPTEGKYGPMAHKILKDKLYKAAKLHSEHVTLILIVFLSNKVYKKGCKYGEYDRWQ